MKSSIIFLLLISFVSDAQIISTIAGTSSRGHAGDNGLATAAILNTPFALKFDNTGNCYFSESGDCTIRKISLFGIITTVVGNGSCGYNGDNISATSAQLNNVAGISFDVYDNMYIADGYNNRVRRVDAVTGIITTIAGTGVSGYGGDNGPATAAMMSNPFDVCFDRRGNLYIADENNFRVRKINTSGLISTFAGTGSSIFSGEGGPATAAGIYTIMGLCADSVGNIYLAARSISRILKVDTSGIMVTICGNGLGYSTGDDGPATDAQINAERLAFDDTGNLYVSGIYKYCIRKIDTHGIIHTIAGKDTTAGFSGDGGIADTAKFDDPVGIDFDHCGNLYIADEINNRIRKISFNPSCILDSIALNTRQFYPLSVSVYPNPATSILTLTAGNAIKQITITNLIGQQVYAQECHTNKVEINVGYLPQDVYFVMVMDEEGNRVVRKVVKE